LSTNLTHLDKHGVARMVDIGAKDGSRRQAIAEAFVRCNTELIDAIRKDTLTKGDLLGTARLAGIMAAKRVDDLIPLCHTLSIDHAQIEAEVRGDGVRLVATVASTGKTGVEMEALTAVAIAALTVIDMGKAIDKGIVIERVRLLEKSGGRSGDYRASDSADTR